MVIIEQKRKADPVIIHTRQGAILPNIKIFSSSNILIFGCSWLPLWGTFLREWKTQICH